MHDGLITFKFWHFGIMIYGSEKSEKCMDGIVSIKFRLFKGKQILLFKKNVDAG